MNSLLTDIVLHDKARDARKEALQALQIHKYNVRSVASTLPESPWDWKAAVVMALDSAEVTLQMLGI